MIYYTVRHGVKSSSGFCRTNVFITITVSIPLLVDS